MAGSSFGGMASDYGKGEHLFEIMQRVTTACLPTQPYGLSTCGLWETQTARWGELTPQWLLQQGVGWLVSMEKAHEKTFHVEV